VSIDTQVLGTVLVRATGQSLSSYTSEKLWKPMGMESEAFWMVDGTGMEMAFGGLNAGLRDFARLGRLYMHKGNWNGEQIVPESWVVDSLTPDAPHLMPGVRANNERGMGYGYQWLAMRQTVISKKTTLRRRASRWRSGVQSPTISPPNFQTRIQTGGNRC